MIVEHVADVRLGLVKDLGGFGVEEVVEVVAGCEGVVDEGLPAGGEGLAGPGDALFLGVDLAGGEGEGHAGVAEDGEGGVPALGHLVGVGEDGVGPVVHGGADLVAEGVGGDLGDEGVGVGAGEDDGAFAEDPEDGEVVVVVGAFEDCVAVVEVPELLSGWRKGGEVMAWDVGAFEVFGPVGGVVGVEVLVA